MLRRAATVRVASGLAGVRGTSFDGILIFTASVDHASLTSYELRVYEYGVEPPNEVASEDIGKPTPDGNNNIRWDCEPLFSPLPIGYYTLKIAAISGGGETESQGVDFSIPLT